MDPAEQRLTGTPIPGRCPKCGKETLERVDTNVPEPPDTVGIVCRTCDYSAHAPR
jgi:hypothetical protein